MLRVLVLAGLFVAAASSVPSSAFKPDSVTVKNTDARIFYHGRWDKSPATWWAGSGFKIEVQDLKTLAITLGNSTTEPSLSIGVSFDSTPFSQINVTKGTNDIPVPEHGARMVRVNSEGWQNNNMNLVSLEVNYVKLNFYRQFLPQGVDQAWPFLVGEYFRAEHNINAQPGATLTDMVSYGNQHGVSFQFFRTEDTGYFYTPNHNFTTPWNFARDVTPTHVVIHIGANDASTDNNVPQDSFVTTYLDFLDRLRELYLDQPIFVFTPWGWPNPDGSVNYYYPGAYQDIVNTRRQQAGDDNIFLVNTTGWVTYDDVFPDNVHPTVAGHAKIAGLFEEWLKNWDAKSFD